MTLAKGQWHTYHLKPMFRWRWRCWRGKHVTPDGPNGANGINRASYTRCPRCRAWLKWGQA